MASRPPKVGKHVSAASSAGARSRSGGQPSTATPASQVLALQHTAGNMAVQRWFGKKKKAEAPETTFDFSDEHKLDLMAAVKDDVAKLVAQKDQLIKAGMSRDEAEVQVFGTAPSHLKQYLPFTGEFDLAKREIDRSRKESGGNKAGELGLAIGEREKKFGYKAGTGVAVDLKPKAVAKDLEIKKEDRRAFEKKALEVLFLKRNEADHVLEAAKEEGDAKKITEAEDKRKALDGAAAVDAMVAELDTLLDAEIALKVGEKEAKYLRQLGVVPPGKSFDAQKKIADRVKDEFLMKPSAHLLRAQDAAKVLGYGAKVVKPLGKQAALLGGAGSVLDQVGRGAGTALSGLLASFKDVVDIVGQVRDLQGGRYDADTVLEIVQKVLRMTGKLAKSASKTVDAFTTGPMGLLANTPAVDAVPGLGIAVNVLTIAASVATVIPPTNRLVATITGEKQTKDAVLKLALERTEMENWLQVSTEIVVTSAQITILAANIAELVSAGGFGVPAGVKLVAKGAVYAKKVADAITLEVYATKTQKAREAAIAQKEGSGEALIGTDIAYAVDAIILKAKGKQGLPPDASAVAVLEAYALLPEEIVRLPFDVIRQKMFDKLATDDEQKTFKMKAKEKLDSVKDAFGDDEKESEFQSLEQDLKKPKKEKGIADKLAKIPSKIAGIPSGIKADVKEKREKSRRIRDVKNITGYRGETDRGKGSAVTHFLKGGDDLQKSEENLREYIVATMTDPQQREAALGALQTANQREKMAKKAGIKASWDKVKDDKVSDRVVSRGFKDKLDAITEVKVLQAMLRDEAGTMTVADLSLLIGEIDRKQGKDEASFSIKERKVKDPSLTQKIEGLTDKMVKAPGEIKQAFESGAVKQAVKGAVKDTGSSIKAGVVGAGESLSELTPGKIKKSIKEKLAEKAEEEEKEKRLKSVMEKTGYDKLYEAGKVKKALGIKSKEEDDAKKRWGYGSEAHLRSWIDQNVKGPNMKQRLLDELVTPKERAAMAKAEAEAIMKAEQDSPVPQWLVQQAKASTDDDVQDLIATGALPDAQVKFLERYLAMKKSATTQVAPKKAPQKGAPVPPVVVDFAKTAPLWLLEGLLAGNHLDDSEAAVVRRQLALRKYSAKYQTENVSA